METFTLVYIEVWIIFLLYFISITKKEKKAEIQDKIDRRKGIFKLFGCWEAFVDIFICGYLMRPVFWFPFATLTTIGIAYYILIRDSNFSNNVIILITFFAALWAGREAMISRQIQAKK